LTTHVGDNIEVLKVVDQLNMVRGILKRPKEKLVVEEDDVEQGKEDEEPVNKTIKLQINEEEPESEEEPSLEDDDDYEDMDDGDQPEIVAAENKNTEKPVQFPEYNRISSIKNKLVRQEMYHKYKREQTKLKIKERKRKLADPNRVKQVPRTIENTREPEDSTVNADDTEAQKEISVDEFASYFNKEIPPKVFITSVNHPRKKTLKFLNEFSSCIPGGQFFPRRNIAIKSLVKDCSENGYTDIMVVNEDRREPNGILVIHLPNGPTANFKLSSVRYRKDIKKGVKHSYERPEVIVNNFSTRLGTCVGRMLASLFHFDPNFKGRRVVTFHNQRDYIFFRHHRSV
jgi:ribosome production factor 1